jgi:protein phosphatase 2C family protein 2/3
VRFQVSEGKELTEIGEMLCDHCLAPDTTSGAGIGCDNMTVLIVALTHGRTKEEWYEWVKRRVRNEYGYKTPGAPPQLYAESRLLSFRARREAQEARERMKAPVNNEPTNGNSDDFLRRHGLTVATVSVNGISYEPGGNIVSDSGQVMFASEEIEEEEEVEIGSSSLFAKTLREQLAKFEKEEGSSDDVDGDGDANMRDVEEEVSGAFEHLRFLVFFSEFTFIWSEQVTEKLSSPTTLQNGDLKETPEQVEVDLRGASSPSQGEVPEPAKA